MKLNILFIDDDSKLLKNLVDNFKNESILGNSISSYGAESFEKGYEMILNNDYDIIILDLCMGDASEEAEKPGLDILTKIQSLDFVPVIFYSGLPNALLEYKSEIVGVVSKGDGIDALKIELERIVNSKLALLKGKIYGHLKESLRKYFWDIVNKEKDVFRVGYIDVSLGYLLLRRFANSLSKKNIKDILGDDRIKNDKAHPMEFYIYPTEIGEYETGEIIYKDNIYYVILTPSCDFVSDVSRTRKADNILLAIAIPLNESEYYKKFESNAEKYKQGLKEFIESRKSDRFFFLPGTAFMENLFVDFQYKIMVKYEELNTFKRIAKLDDPFAQSMVSSFIRYYNRIGSPNIDSDYIINLIETAKMKSIS